MKFIQREERKRRKWENWLFLSIYEINNIIICDIREFYCVVLLRCCRFTKWRILIRKASQYVYLPPLLWGVKPHPMNHKATPHIGLTHDPSHVEFESNLGAREREKFDPKGFPGNPWKMISSATFATPSTNVARISIPSIFCVVFKYRVLLIQSRLTIGRICWNRQTILMD